VQTLENLNALDLNSLSPPFLFFEIERAFDARELEKVVILRAKKLFLFFLFSIKIEI